MKNQDYKPRIIDSKVDEYLDVFGAVCIEGPKWCGKTWTGESHSLSKIMLGDPKNNFQNKNLVRGSLEIALDGEWPRLIDEWQEVPELWDAVRYKVDETIDNGKYILTGSSTPNRKGVLHSGAGRIARLKMRPMSLYESGHSSGLISLKDICYGKIESKLTDEVHLKDLIDYVVRGGWPRNQLVDKSRIRLLPQQYIKALLEDDIDRVDDIKRDKRKVELLLRSLARNESTTVSDRSLCRDIKDIDDESMSKDTVADYINALSKLFIFDNQRPYGSSLRSSIRVKQAEKRHFVDPSLAVALLNATPDMLLNDLQTFGFLFEALVERDLRIYGESFDGELYHYQDYNGKEMDAVIVLPGGEWCGFEIKLGAHEIDEGANNLLKIKDEIVKDGGKAPNSLCVVCGMSNAAYKREDGVFVVPITALKD